MTEIFGLEVPFAGHLGIEALWHEPGRTRLGMSLPESLSNSQGAVHGGAVLTLLDIALASAARTLIQGRVTTVDLQAAFLMPGRGRLIGEGCVIRAGGTLIFCEGEVRDDKEVLIAKATGIFKRIGVKVATPT